MNKSDVRVERIRGKGPGGQNKNKVASCVRLTHVPTGLVVRIDGRDQHKNLKLAWKELERRLADWQSQQKSDKRKAKRDAAIKDTPTIRTYDFKTNRVKDHRSGKTASLKDVLEKGKLELLQCSATRPLPN